MTAIVQFLIKLDTSLFQAINSVAGKSAVLDWVARVGADDHIVPVVLAILLLLTVLIAKNESGRETAFRCFACALVALAISMIILYGLNSVFFRPRPFAGRAVRLAFYHNTDSSFPSNASTAAFALSFSVLLYKRKLGLLMLAVSCYPGLARVFVGVHYPLDIAGAFLLGLSSAAIARVLEPLYRPAARMLTALEYRLLAAWRPPARIEKGERP